MHPTLFSDILRQYWGYDAFRGIQLPIIESIAAGRDTLGLMPTGGGKSITFQVPAMAMDGLCLVITPLIALMKDQVEHLRRHGILAAALHSGMAHSDIIATLETCIFGHTKFLYVSPERLESELFQKKLARIPVSFITVDEAHCISQWGYDFRPSYLHIADIRRLKPDAPILALTATATPYVVSDIMAQLAFREENVFRMSFERRNLAYIVRHTQDKFGGLIEALEETPGTAIIYTRNRRQTREVSEHLAEQHIAATYYHAGLPHDERDHRQQQWQKGEVRVMVATNAFGMGIDKPDVRLVLHLEMPDSVEAYFQEAGRAGRDGQAAKAILLYSRHDRTTLLQRIPQTYPDLALVRDVYDHLCYYYQLALGDGQGVTREFDLAAFSAVYGHFPLHVHSALTLLDQAHYIEYRTDEESVSRLQFSIHRDQLYAATATDGEDTNRLLTLILRTYTGIFADYANIDEDHLAKELHTDAHLVYARLKALAQRRIVSYIPRKRTAYISFLRPRADSTTITLAEALYTERKERYRERIESVIAYAEQDDTCRSQHLLQYFGDHTAHDCLRCDVCTHDPDHHPPLDIRRHIADDILAQLRTAPKEKPAPHQHNPLQFAATLQELVSNNYITLTPTGLYKIAQDHNPY